MSCRRTVDAGAAIAGIPQPKAVREADALAGVRRALPAAGRGLPALPSEDARILSKPPRRRQIGGFTIFRLSLLEVNTSY